MGIFKDIRERRKESSAFKKMVGTKELQIRREAFEEEALRQAKRKGRQLAIQRANKPTLSQTFVNFAKAQQQQQQVQNKEVKKITKEKSKKTCYPKKESVLDYAMKF